MGDVRFTAGSEFIETLSWVTRACSRNNLIPELTGVLIEQDGSEIALCATDSKRTHTARASVDGEGQAAVLCSGAILTDLCRSLSGSRSGGATLHTEGGILHLASGRSHYRLATMSPDLFPGQETGGEAESSLSVPGDALLRMIEGVRHCEGQGDTNAPGMVLTVSDGDLVAYATQGTLLSVLSEPLPQSPGDFRAIVPLEALEQAVRDISPEGAVRLALSQGRLGASAGERAAVLRTYASTVAERLLKWRADPPPGASLRVRPAEVAAALDRLLLSLPPSKRDRQRVEFTAADGELSLVLDTGSEEVVTTAAHDQPLGQEHSRSLGLGLLRTQMKALTGAEEVVVDLGDPRLLRLYVESAAGGLGFHALAGRR